MSGVGGIPSRQIRATFSSSTVTVYQAFPSAIARPALIAQRFVPPFKMSRMTWIKPSFLWMMYRSGWATKENQEVILAIQISRTGFEWALENSALTDYDKHVYRDRREWEERKKATPVRVQWDPERSLALTPQPWRSIQVGLSREAVNLYVHDWISEIVDITPMVRKAHSLVIADRQDLARTIIPEEEPYAIPGRIKKIIGATDQDSLV